MSGFDLDELKRSKKQFDNLFPHKLQCILDCLEFGDALQEYLTHRIEQGYNFGILYFEVSKTDNSQVFLKLMTSDAFDLHYDIGEASQEQIGDLTRYIEKIENKLQEFKLNFTPLFDDAPSWDKITERSTVEFKFKINLDFD